jgi:hypothetical protein
VTGQSATCARDVQGRAVAGETLKPSRSGDHRAFERCMNRRQGGLARLGQQSANNTVDDVDRPLDLSSGRTSCEDRRPDRGLVVGQPYDITTAP